MLREFFRVLFYRLALRKTLLTPFPLPAKGPGRRRKDLHPANAFRQALLSRKDACDRNPRRPWESPGGSMPHNFMTALGGRGEAQSALLAFGGRIRVLRASGVTKQGRRFIAGFPLAPGTLSTGFLII